MGDMNAHGDLREASIEIVVIRKDGTREDHGVVSYYHRNPFKRWAWEIKQKLKAPKAV